MSGLFDTMIALAIGQVPSVTHRPRQRYDGTEPVFLTEGFLLEDEQVLVTQANIRTAPQTLSSTNISPVMPPKDPAQIVSNYGSVPIETSEVPSKPEPSLGNIKEANPYPASVFALLPPSSDSQIGLGQDIGDQLKTTSIDVSEEAILLPTYREPDRAIPEERLSTNQTSKMVHETSSRKIENTPRFELRIGRIEVTNPRTNLVAPSQPNRPVSVPRARPRQSLDDYLRGRKR
jgi:hypothetical protein